VGIIRYCKSKNTLRKITGNTSNKMRILHLYENRILKKLHTYICMIEADVITF